jgi:hypothetical protein
VQPVGQGFLKQASVEASEASKLSISKVGRKNADARAGLAMMRAARLIGDFVTG